MLLLSYFSEAEILVCYFCSERMLITSIPLKEGSNRLAHVLSLHSKAWKRQEGVLHIYLTEG